MAGLPPWSPPTDYCTSMAGVPMSNTGNSYPYPPMKAFGFPFNWSQHQGSIAGIIPGWWQDPNNSTYTWTSDNVFCMSAASDFWKTCLFIALAFWGFFTVLQLFSTLDIRHGHGQTMARAVTLMLRQFIVLILAVFSFFLILLLHQLLFLIVNTLLNNSLAQWRVDSLWVPGVPDATAAKSFNQALGVGGPALGLLEDAQKAFTTSNVGTNFVNAVTNGNAAGQNQFLGTAAGQLFNALIPIEQTLDFAWPMIDFLITFLLTGTAPLAIVFVGFEYTKPAFNLWIRSATELAGLTLLSAAALSLYSALGFSVCSTSHSIACVSNTGINAQSYAWLMLGLGGLVGGLEVAYIWRLVGNLINFGTSASQAEYNRDVGMIKAVLNAVGFLATAFGGAVGLIGGTAAAAAGGTISAVGNAVSDTGQGMMSMIPQGSSTMAPLPSYYARGLANSMFNQSAVYTDTGEPVTGKDLEEATALANKGSRYDLERHYDAQRWVTFSGSYKIKVGGVGGREVQVTNSRKFGSLDSTEPLTIAQSAAAFTMGALRAAQYERNQGLQPVKGGGEALGLNHLVAQNQPAQLPPVQQVTQNVSPSFASSPLPPSMQQQAIIPHPTGLQQFVNGKWQDAQILARLGPSRPPLSPEIMPLTPKTVPPRGPKQSPPRTPKNHP